MDERVTVTNSAGKQITVVKGQRYYINNISPEERRIFAQNPRR